MKFFKNKKYLFGTAAFSCIFLAAALSIMSDKIFHISGIETQKISFSKPSGFYPKDFDLKITGSNNIYYTLDGSIPTEKSFKYTKPIHISDASNNRNTISMRKDISTGYNQEILNKYCKNCNQTDYQIPNFLIDKATVVRAVAITPQNKKTDVISATYFVEFDKKKGYKDLNVISVMADNKNLFDYDSGIYVTGRDFDKWFKTITEEEKNILWPFWDANYHRNGKRSEIPVHIDFFNKNKNFILGKDCGMRLQGNFARGLPNKSIKIYAREKYDGSNIFPCDLTDTAYFPKRLALFNGSNDVSKLKDYLVHESCRNKQFGTLHFKPYVMFLNGEYWGFYWLTDRYDDDYIYHYYGISRNKQLFNIKKVIIDENTTLRGNYSDKKNYNSMINFIVNHDLSIRENYEIAKKLIDIDSFIDYLSTEIYINNYDWPHNNISMWKTVKPGRKKYDDGKWRCLLFDVNLSMNNPNSNQLRVIKKYNKFINKMLTNEEIKQRHAEAIIALSFNEFEPERIISMIEKYEKYINEPIQKEFKRFYGDNYQIKLDEFYKETNNMKEFFKSRPVNIYMQYCKELDFDKINNREVKRTCEHYRQ